MTILLTRINSSFLENSLNFVVKNHEIYAMRALWWHLYKEREGIWVISSL